MLRPGLARIGHSLRSFRRSLLHVPPLPHNFEKDGVDGLIGPAAFNMAWTQYQSLMVEKLNRLTAGRLTKLYSCGWRKRSTEELIHLYSLQFRSLLPCFSIQSPETY